MKEEHKKLIEDIIIEFKKNDYGKIYTHSFVNLIEDNNQRLLITRIIIDDLRLVEKVNNHFFMLTKKGWDFTTFKEIEAIELATIEKEKIDFERSKIDLEIAKKILKEYPKTKWFARIGFGLAISLAILEFIKYLKNK